MLYHTSQAVRCPKHDGGEEKADDENNGFHRRKCFYFIFIFRDVKRNYCFSLHVGWIGCRMDRLPAALVVWMPVLPDAGPANCDRPVSPRGPCLYNKLGDRRRSRSTSPGPWATASSCLSGNWIQAERVPRSLNNFFYFMKWRSRKARPSIKR